MTISTTKINEHKILKQKKVDIEITSNEDRTAIGEKERQELNIPE